MHWIKSFIFCSLIMMLKVGADNLTNDETSHDIPAISTTLTPIVLEMSTQHRELKNLQSAEIKSELKPEKNNEILKEHENNTDKEIRLEKNKQYPTTNDVEVFDYKPGPTMEKQEEEPEAEPEAEETAAEEEAKEEEAEAEPEPAAEEEAKEEEAEAEPEPAAEEEPKEDIPEPVAEEEPTEEEKVEDEAQPEEGNKEEAPENDEQEMPNDEPAKEEDPAPNSSSVPPTDVKDNQVLSCFSCTSVDDVNCHIKPTHQENCPKVNTGDNGKHGCYTLYKADTNMTMRGCVDDLAEDGLKYCLTNNKLCLLCYTNGCNKKLAPSNATIQQSNIYLMLILNVFSILLIKKHILFN